MHTAEPIYAGTSLAGVASHRGRGWRQKNGDFLKIILFLYSLCIPKTSPCAFVRLPGARQPPRLRLAPPRQPRGGVLPDLRYTPPFSTNMFFLVFFGLVVCRHLTVVCIFLGPGGNYIGAASHRGGSKKSSTAAVLHGYAIMPWMYDFVENP